MSYNYIYLIHPGEYKKENKNIYKIGKTCRINWTRIQNYKDESELILQVQCINCHIMERQIINKFKKTYKKHSEGNEYFEGDVRLMQKDIYELLLVEQKEYYEKIEKELLEKAKTELYAQTLVCNNVDERENDESVENENIEDDIAEIQSKIVEDGNIDDQIVEEQSEDESVEDQNDNENMDDKGESIQNKNEMTTENDSKYYYVHEHLKRCKNSKKVECTRCNVIISTITNFKEHLKSKKHINMVVKREPGIFQCDKCKKIYPYSGSLWKHKQKCNGLKISDAEYKLKMSQKLEDLEKKVEILSKTPSNLPE